MPLYVLTISTLWHINKKKRPKTEEMELKWAKLAGNFAALLMVTAAMTIYAHIELKTPAHFVLILNSA